MIMTSHICLIGVTSDVTSDVNFPRDKRRPTAAARFKGSFYFLFDYERLAGARLVGCCDVTTHTHVWIFTSARRSSQNRNRRRQLRKEEEEGEDEDEEKEDEEKKDEEKEEVMYRGRFHGSTVMGWWG